MTIAYTLVNIAYLPFAKTLADSFVLHNPEIPFYICLFDDKKEIQDSVFLDYNIYDKDHLKKEEYNEMRNRYDNMSLACALKPFFADALIRDYNPENIMYLDADMMAFSSFGHELENFSKLNKSVGLTAHQYQIIESDSELKDNQKLRKYGVYNAGFLMIANNPKGIEFLEWWKRILAQLCIRQDSNGIYYDQTWLDLVPAYFSDSFYPITNLGFNVAYWNWNERLISKNPENQIIINGNYPLVFYHFARFNYYNPAELENYSSFPNIILENLFLTYKNLLKQNLIEKYQHKKEEKKEKTSLLRKLRLSFKNRLQNFVNKL